MKDKTIVMSGTLEEVLSQLRYYRTKYGDVTLTEVIDKLEKGK